MSKATGDQALRSPALRETQLGSLAGGSFDVLVVGGGINGAVSAAALCAAGARVALVERGDFACGTSQESSNLVWGGIKYLENLEFGLVRNLCAAREELLRAYPSNVRRIRFLATAEAGGGVKRSRPALLAGSWLYWLISGLKGPQPMLRSKRSLAREERLLDPARIRGGVEYSDAILVENDARFVFSFVRLALDRGAAAVNYVELQGLEHKEGRWQASLQDRVSGRELQLSARAVVNAAGPRVDELNGRLGVSTRAHHIFSKGVHLIVEGLSSGRRVLAFFDDDQRPFFILPMGERSVIGTTDTLVDSPDAQVTASDRDFLLEHVNRRMLLERPLRTTDIIAERCGVRPLVLEDGSSLAAGALDSWLSLSRKHVLELETERAYLSIFGGKLTDCLNVGAEVVAELRKAGLQLSDPGKTWYGEDCGAAREEYFSIARAADLDRHLARSGDPAPTERMWRLHGPAALDLLARMEAHPASAEPVLALAPHRRCELELMAEREMILSLEDFLRRRSMLGLMHRARDLAADPGMVELRSLLQVE